MKKFVLRAATLLLTLAMLIPLCAFALSVPAAAATEVKPFEGKTVSILGDSISTWEDYSNGKAASTTNSTIIDNATYYKPATPFTLSSVNDTWWMQAIEELGGSLLVNNSWSGSGFYAEDFGSYKVTPAYVDRCVQLHDNTNRRPSITIEPDVIAIYIGTNDFNALKGTAETFTTEGLNYDALKVDGEYKTPTTAAEAYAIMLAKITEKYAPNEKKGYEGAEIYCFTILEWQGLNDAAKAKHKAFNATIAEIAEHYGAYVVDLYGESGITPATDASDKVQNTHLANTLHPNKYGMDAITNCFVSTVYRNSRYMPENTELFNVEYNVDTDIFKQGAPRVVLGGELKLDFLDKSNSASKWLKVMMGGEDITATCKTDDGIYIPEVTADVTLITPFSGKNISILGDSISTYEGYSNNGNANSTIKSNASYYKDKNYGFGPEETWWYQAADELGANILVNNSYSASSFSMDSAGPAAYIDRCVQLHNNDGVNPDIIAVYIGTNDYNITQNEENANNGKIAIGYASDLDYSKITTSTVPTNTAEAYAVMIAKMKERYPDAEIYCFTLLKTTKVYSEPKRPATPEDVWALEQFNDVIRNVANHYGANLVDLCEDSGIRTDVLKIHLANEVHPNAAGMDAITSCFLNSVYRNSKYMPDDLSVYNVDYRCTTDYIQGGAVTTVFGGGLTIKFAGDKNGEMNNVRVYMDGENITLTTRFSDRIEIPVVTGDVVIEDPDWHECQFVEKEIIDVTCTTNGNTILACTICGAEKIGNVVKCVGHNFVFDRVVKQFDPCVDKGSEIHKCTVCQKEIIAAIVPPVGHDYDDAADATCNICGYERELSDAVTGGDSSENGAPSENPPATEPEQSGCKSSVTGGIALVAFVALGAGIAFKKKRK